MSVLSLFAAVEDTKPVFPQNWLFGILFRGVAIVILTAPGITRQSNPLVPNPAVPYAQHWEFCEKFISKIILGVLLLLSEGVSISEVKLKVFFLFYEPVRIQLQWQLKEKNSKWKIYNNKTDSKFLNDLFLLKIFLIYISYFLVNNILVITWHLKVCTRSRGIANPLKKIRWKLIKWQLIIK